MVQQMAQNNPAMASVPQATQKSKTMPTSLTQPIKKKSKWWLWLIVILLSLGVGFLLGYFLF